MTTFTIKSRKLNRVITFTHFADDAEKKTSRMWADTNGRKGVCGDQCMKQGVSGDAFEVTEKNARRVAYAWIKKISE